MERNLVHDCPHIEGAPFYFSECLRGYYWDRSARECQICSRGHYRNTTSATFCVRCPTGHTTEQEGSTSRSQCYRSKKLICTRQSYCKRRTGYRLSSAHSLFGCEGTPILKGTPILPGWYPYPVWGYHFLRYSQKGHVTSDWGTPFGRNLGPVIVVPLVNKHL